MTCLSTEPCKACGWPACLTSILLSLVQLRESGASRADPSVRCRCSQAGCTDCVAAKVYTPAAGSVSNLEVAGHEIETYYGLADGPEGPVEGIAHMVDHYMDNDEGMAFMVQT